MYLRKWTTKIIASAVMLLVPTVSVVAHETSTRASLGHGGDFTLQSFDGPVSLEQMRGKVVLLFFGFTSCVDICPTTLAVLSKVFARLTEDELEKVIALFISLDPERDTPEVLKKYTGYFHSNIVGVTAREEVLSKVVADYGVAYERKEVPGSALGYVIYHTPDVLVVDEQGQLLDMRIQFTTTTEEIALGIKGLLGNNQ